MNTDTALQDFLLSLQRKARQQVWVKRHGCQVQGGYVFRGEGVATGLDGKARPVTSQLYRWMQNAYRRLDCPTPGRLDEAPLSAEEERRLPDLQTQLVDQMHQMLPAPDTDEIKLLCRMQQLGGKTNLIDFTRDYLVALFFACYDLPVPQEGTNWRRDGRIIFLPDDDNLLLTPPIANARTVVQKKVFCWVPQGIIPETWYETMTVPHQLKPCLQKYLAQCHDISPRTVFPDFMGAVQYVSSHTVLSRVWSAIIERNGNGG